MGMKFLIQEIALVHFLIHHQIPLNCLNCTCFEALSKYNFTNLPSVKKTKSNIAKLFDVEKQKTIALFRRVNFFSLLGSLDQHSKSIFSWSNLTDNSDESDNSDANETSNEDESNDYDLLNYNQLLNLIKERNINQQHVNVQKKICLHS